MAESRTGATPDAASRELDADEQGYVDAARDIAFVLYEGVRVPHRSCGIALAETFGLPTRPYQVLRRGGISGNGACGAMRAGEHILGELLGSPDPTAAVTPALRNAVLWYQRAAETQLAGDNAAPDVRCNTLVRRFAEFTSPERARFCTNLAATMAALTAEALVRFAPERPTLAAIPKPPQESHEAK